MRSPLDIHFLFRSKALKHIPAAALILLLLVFFRPVTALAEEKSQAPDFSARIEYTYRGYVVRGTFTEFPPDVVRVQSMGSLDGNSYLSYQEEFDWDLRRLGLEDPDEQRMLQNQICLYPHAEPLKSYLAGETDRFYLKLRLTLEDGTVYDTQTAVIDRGEPQQVPEGLSLSANFAPDVFILERKPLQCYGRYQITVREDADWKEIMNLLPDTLPIEVQLSEGGKFAANGIVDCPVTWKSQSLPALTAGESITIPDAAGTIMVPGGSLLHTPMGTYRLEEPLGIDRFPYTDEVRLVLNVVSSGSSPAGALSANRNGLEMSFFQKPTGAANIRAYLFSDEESKWIELPGLSLTEAVNAYPSAANSGYALLLDNAQEPYRSWLAAEASGSDPSSFLIGLYIEGGVYDGKQLILPWPSNYEIPPYLPKLEGSGGNENNVGSGNGGSSTAEGQRPHLPQKEPDRTSSPLQNVPADETNSAQGSSKQPSPPLRTESGNVPASSALADPPSADNTLALKSPQTGDTSFHFPLAGIVLWTAGLFGAGAAITARAFQRKSRSL